MNVYVVVMQSAREREKETRQNGTGKYETNEHVDNE